MIDGSDFFPARSRLRPEFQYLRDHPEVGLSMYEYHADGSGVMYSSRRRPVLNLRPGADGWAFTPDTNLVAFLERWGASTSPPTRTSTARAPRLLSRYRVVVTGSHPEYFSTAMLDALEAFLRHGGRLMYLGGNGFYWRVAFTPSRPGVMEVRRAEDGTRGWIAEPGEYYHEWGGEYGGLWRRLGRPPNQLVGVGFAAQGFDRAAPYRADPGVVLGRAAWIFDGVEADDVIGDYGVGGGAAGQEIDRFDERLGSPHHAVVLAYSDEHPPRCCAPRRSSATRPPGRSPEYGPTWCSSRRQGAVRCSPSAPSPGTARSATLRQRHRPDHDQRARPLRRSRAVRPTAAGVLSATGVRSSIGLVLSSPPGKGTRRSPLSRASGRDRKHRPAPCLPKRTCATPTFRPSPNPPRRRTIHR